MNSPLYIGFEDYEAVFDSIASESLDIGDPLWAQKNVINLIMATYELKKK